jgi:YD repeat-containing protein
MWDDPNDPNETYAAKELNPYAQVRLRSTPDQFQSYEYDEDGNLINVRVAADMSLTGWPAKTTARALPRGVQRSCPAFRRPLV